MDRSPIGTSIENPDIDYYGNLVGAADVGVGRRCAGVRKDLRKRSRIPGIR